MTSRQLDGHRRLSEPLQVGLADEFFLSETQLRHGPLALLYRFLHMARDAVLDRGVTLQFGSFDDLVRTNERHSDSWRSLVPLLDPRHGPLGSSFCILGRNGQGDIVATQAARLFDFGKKNLKAEGESGRLLNPQSRLPKDLRAPRGNRLELRFSGGAANQIAGRAIYAGGVWYRPDYRGRMLSAIIPRIGRTIAYGRWNTRYTFSFAEEPIVAKGLLARYGYAHSEPGLVIARGGETVFAGSLVWIPRDELVSDLSAFLTSFGAQVDVVAQRRRA